MCFLNPDRELEPETHSIPFALCDRRGAQCASAGSKAVMRPVDLRAIRCGTLVSLQSERGKARLL